MAERIPLPPERPQAGVLTRADLRPLMFWSPGSEPPVLTALGVWGSGGECGGVDSWRVLKAALAVSGIDAPPDAHNYPEAMAAWIERHRGVLDSLAHAWRVEAARFDLVRLWGSIDNAAPSDRFRVQIDRYYEAGVEAAHAAVAAWKAGS